ncbi:MAG: twin-arginine translocation signal domain-containing protein [Thermoguttaceae bacterium]
MQSPRKRFLSRRDFLKNTGRVAAATTLAASMVPNVHAAENNTIQVALIGCGGRGSGAAGDAMSVKNGPIKLVAMADAFEDRLESSYRYIKRQFRDQVDVPKDRQFVGFDAYQKAMDCLKPGDIAIFATPPAFRWVHFAYAIQKGLNVFMEKPVTVDGPTSRRMFGLAEQATAKNLKVGVGLMSRHSRAMQELSQRIQDGEIGDLVLMRGYRMDGPGGSMRSLPKPAGIPEVAYQIRRFHSFLWASGGCFSDFYIHIIDHCSWMKNAWPIQAQALGGRHYRGDYVDQNFDTYSVEYTFADETKLIMDGRCISGCKDIYHSFAHGTKGTAIISRSNDCDGPSATFKGLGSSPANILWKSKVKADEGNPYQNEWNDLVDAVRNNKPYNEAKRGVEASLVTSMGRMAAHTGQIITYEQILKGNHEFAPGLDKLAMHGPAPLVADAKGKYPVPQPGILTEREY